jgi:hypothetical protein
MSQTNGLSVTADDKWNFCLTAGTLWPANQERHAETMLDREGEFVEHLAGVEDSLLADATYEAALRRWPKVAIILRQGARVIRDSRKPRLVK